MDDSANKSPSLLPSAPEPEHAAGASAVPGWKSEITARVRAHRRSRTPANQPALPGMEDAISPRSIAARVVERYSRLPSYREAMEREAGAGQAAEELLSGPAAAPDAPQPVPVVDTPAPRQPELLRYSVSCDSLPAPRSTPPQASPRFPAVKQEPAQRGGYPATDPMEVAVVEPTIPLPASFVAQPRELIAPRKARPRLAEGPLREETRTVAHETVAARRETVANSPAGGREIWPSEPGFEAVPAMRHSSPVSSEWLSIDLDSDASARGARPASPRSDGPALHVASLEDRLFSGLIDIALTLTAFLMFIVVFAISSTSLPHGRVALVTAGLMLFAMWLIYQLLFFGFTDATPGMRHVKIALCTFDDENPTRAALRGRIAASLLSALPLGLGFLWALFDDDSMGWHDRITRTYQRSYREI